MEGNEAQPGIIPRSMQNLFSLIQQASANTIASTYKVVLSYLEIYQEQIYDLLMPTASAKDRVKLDIREAKPGVYKVANLSEQVVGSLEDFKKVYTLGVKNRSVAATKLN